MVRPLSLLHLFVNVKIAPGGWCRVGLRDPYTNATLPLFHPSKSILTTTSGRDTTGSPCGMDKQPFDSTKAAVKWEGVDNLAAVAGKPVQLLFELEGASLYSFWVSELASTGTSRGFLGASGRDL